MLDFISGFMRGMYPAAKSEEKRLFSQDTWYAGLHAHSNFSSRVSLTELKCRPKVLRQASSRNEKK